MDITELESYNLADAVKFNDSLNPRLWDKKEHLKPEVREKLLAIADDFRESLGVKDIDLEDITISGSNAAFNYTPNSDIDLHLVVDIPEDEVYKELFDAKKFEYNNQHNIRIGGFPVELYVQDSKEPHVSQGIYSILNDKWLSVPKRKKADINDSSVRHKYDLIQNQIEDAVSSGDYDKMAKMMKRVKNLRKAGLDKSGEFSPENLAFKMLRTQGVIQKLIDARNEAKDRELSLAEQNKKKKKYTYGFKEDVGGGLPSKLYHASSPTNRKSILTRGLSVKSDRTGLGGIYLSDMPDGQLDVYQVNTHGLDIEPDPTEVPHGQNWFISYSDIPPRNLKLIHKHKNGLNEDASDGLPNENSLGRPIAQTPEALANFWRWFQGSKVVDEQGRPLVMVHSTQAGNIHTFNKSDYGIWFAPSHDTVEADVIAGEDEFNLGYLPNPDPWTIPTYAIGATYYPVYLKITNPAPIGSDYPDSDKLEKEGYDGVIYKDEVCVVFNPHQIKSATGNRGSFKKFNTKITHEDVDLTPDGVNPTTCMFLNEEGELPNENSDDQPITNDPQALANFWRWFQGSKVVDDEGRPQVRYHGTSHDFQSFDRGLIFTSSGPTLASMYSWGGYGPGYGDVMKNSELEKIGPKDSYAPKVLPLYVRATNIWHPFDDAEELVEQMVDDGFVDPDDSDEMIEIIEEGNWESIEDDNIIATIRKLGYDGLQVFENGEETLAVFSPLQLKSAIGNRGSFKKFNTKITHEGNAHQKLVKEAIQSLRLKQKSKDFPIFNESTNAKAFNKFYKDAALSHIWESNNFLNKYGTSHGKILGYTDVNGFAVKLARYLKESNLGQKEDKTVSYILSLLSDYMSPSIGDTYDIISMDIDPVYKKILVKTNPNKKINDIQNGMYQTTDGDLRTIGNMKISSNSNHTFFAPVGFGDKLKSLLSLKRKDNTIGDYQVNFDSDSAIDRLGSELRKHLKEDVDLTPDGVNPTTCMFLNEEDRDPKDIATDFIKYCVDKLGIETMPRVRFKKDPQWSVRNKTFGRYSDQDHTLVVSLANRHIMDILRTIAHELTHKRQHETQHMPMDAGDTGSKWENEANAKAGVLMRNYAKQHPEYFDDKPIVESRLNEYKDNQNFQKWFNGSKVVDANGEPLVVYHGTSRDFGAFKKKGVKPNFTSPQKHLGYFFTDDPKYAGQYTGWENGSIMPVYLSIKNPKIESIKLIDEIEDKWKQWQAKEYVENLKADGHDGIIFTGVARIGHLTEYVAFYPSQIKSATGNKGSFDWDNDSIIDEYKDTPEFKKWFRGSKAREKGKPQTWYHATHKGDEKDPLGFDKFKTDSFTSLGSHFGTSDQANALIKHKNKAFGKNKNPRVIPVHLAVKNPLRLHDEGEWYPMFILLQLLDKGLIDRNEYDNLMASKHIHGKKGVKIVKDIIRRLGYDSIVYLNRYEIDAPWIPSNERNGMPDKQFKKKYGAHDSYIILDQGQAKSPFNKGTFDPKKGIVDETDILGEATGYIPTAAQANDPRFLMALTHDVRPGTLGKAANALSLNTDSQGHPQIANPNGRFKVSDFKQNIYESFNEFSRAYSSGNMTRGKTRYLPHRYNGLFVSESILTELPDSFLKRRKQASNFSENFKNLDKRNQVTIEVGNDIALLSTTAYPSEDVSKVELSGFVNPKTIAKVNLDIDDKIDSIVFDDGSTFPEAAEFTTVGGINITNTIFFPNHETASKAYTSTWMLLSSLEGKGWKVENYLSEGNDNLVESLQKQLRAFKEEPEIIDESTVAQLAPNYKLWISPVKIKQPNYSGYIDVTVSAPDMRRARTLIKAMYNVQEWQIGATKEFKPR
jgi:predicted nucleotidyltransferase